MSESSRVETEVLIVGGGIAGLALADRLVGRGIDVQVFERRERPGGNIRSELRDGFRVEWGPNGFLDNEPAMLRLVESLGLGDRVRRASELAEVRWIVRDRALRRLPSKPPQFLVSDLLSLRGRLRVLLEWAQPTRRSDEDESVHDFARRRIGAEAADVLVDAMVTGVYAGDSRRLSLGAAFPRMQAMEREHGGLFRAMRARRKAGSKGSPMGPGGTLTSFVDGAETLIQALAAKLGDRLHCGHEVTALVDDEGRFRVLTASGPEVVTRRLVLASPSWTAAPLLESIDHRLAGEVAAIGSAPVVVVALAFAEADVADVERGFGFLVPGRESMPILGTLFDSWIFPERAPAGSVLWRTMIGGIRNPAVIGQTDEALIDQTRATLRDLLRLTAAPSAAHVLRNPRGIPQYAVGHPQRLARIDRLLADHPGLRLAGNSYRGIAMNACVKEAEQLGDALAAELS